MSAKKMVVKTRQEMLLSLKQQGVFAELVAAGLIKLHVANWLDIYNHYIEECQSNQKTIANQFTADHWGVSERNLYRIIEYMEQPFKIFP